MEHSNHIFTRMRSGIDYRVWLTMLLMLFISAFTLAFKMMNWSEVPCADYSIIPEVIVGKPGKFYVGQSIVFKASVATGSNLVWDFGDGTPKVAGNNIRHSFLHTQTYQVSCVSNEACSQAIAVRVDELTNKSSVNTPLIRNDVIAGTDTPHVGEAVMYTSTLMANRYEWSVLNTPLPIFTDSIASYTFRTTGTRIIQLKLNGDDNKVYRDTVTVLAAPKQEDNSVAGIERLPPKVIPIPYVASFEPSSGPAGTVVIIKGRNFNTQATVSFGDMPAASVLVLSPTDIRATVGTGMTGKIAVTTNNGKSTSQGVFAYTPPAISNTPATTPASPVKKKPVAIAPEEFKRLLQQVCEGKLDASGFDPYLCNGSATKVLADNDWTTLGEFCNKLKNRKKGLRLHKEYRINTVAVARDASNNNCVITLTVDYK